MSAPPITVERTDTLAYAEELMLAERIRHLPVVDGDVLVGLLSQRDILAASISSLSAPGEEEDLALKRKVEVGQVMRGGVETVTEETPVVQAAERMLAEKLGCLPVIDARHHLVGIVTDADYVRLARDLLGAPRAPRERVTARPRSGPPARR